MNPDAAIRLQVFLSAMGFVPRRDAMLLVKQGQVSVNGQVVTEPSFSVTGKEEIKVNGQRIDSRKFEYIMLNKPAGYVTTKEDKFADKIVVELLPPELQYLHPVGRLDKDTEGLLLFTNDGDLTQTLTHPSCGVDKIYFVRVGGRVSATVQKQIEAGVMLDDEKTAPAKICSLKYVVRDTEFLLSIHEGRKRQIRRMMQGLGHRVLFLQRIEQGPVQLGGLKLGAWRRLTAQEIKEIKNLK